MAYNQSPPDSSKLFQLAHELHFPATIESVIKNTLVLGYDPSMIDFLHLFLTSPRGITFQNRADFYSRTSELALLMCEEQQQPYEPILSLQD